MIPVWGAFVNRDFAENPGKVKKERKTECYSSWKNDLRNCCPKKRSRLISAGIGALFERSFSRFQAFAPYLKPLASCLKHLSDTFTSTFTFPGKNIGCGSAALGSSAVRIYLPG
jgi:hypothetical protein